MLEKSYFRINSRVTTGASPLCDGCELINYEDVAMIELDDQTNVLDAL